MDMWKCHADHKQLPVPDEDSMVFWEGCLRNRLLIQQCDACYAFRFPPSPICPHCTADVATWQEDPGAGEVMTFCIYRSALAGPAWRSELPYVVAVVRLDFSEVNMLSKLLCDVPESVSIGMPVQVAFERLSERICLPKFVPRQT